MKIEFKVYDEDGTILTQATEEVAPNFSMHDFLNKTVPGWEATVEAFYNKESGTFEQAFKNAENTIEKNVGRIQQSRATDEGMPEQSAYPAPGLDNADPEGERIKAQNQGNV